jgi:hypothetical protein
MAANETKREPMVMTVTDHERREWSRMAQAAYAVDRNDVGHRYSVASAILKETDVRTFDALMNGYRAWLVFGTWPAIEVRS